MFQQFTQVRRDGQVGSMCRAVCRNYAKGGGRSELGVLKKKTGCSFKQRSGEHWKTISLVLLREGGRD